MELRWLLPLRAIFPVAGALPEWSISRLSFTEEFVRLWRKIQAGPDAEIRPGNSLPLKSLPTGTAIHNIELKAGRGGQIVRSAGASAQLLAKEGDYAHVRLPSGEVRLVRSECMATIGQVGNVEHQGINLGKAGRKRWLGWRPTVRGSAMSPRDHPPGRDRRRADRDLAGAGADLVQKVTPSARVM